MVQTLQQRLHSNNSLHTQGFSRPLQQPEPQAMLHGDRAPEMFRDPTGLTAQHIRDLPTTDQGPLDAAGGFSLKGAQDGELIGGQADRQSSTKALDGWQNPSEDLCISSTSGSNGRGEPAPTDGQENPMAGQTLGCQVGELAENHHLPTRLRRSEQAKQGLPPVAAHLLKLITDLRCEGMGGIHHPAKATASIQQIADARRPSQGTDMKLVEA
jgi:hypothetical protein